jgi:aminoglycoside 3-N-acetyltransferase
MPLSKDDILQGLRELGVQPGMVVMAHSALGAFGQIEGGADTVIDALIEAVGPEGTLLMPAMGGAPVFDVDATPSNVGRITDCFWRREDVTRSIHPTHSVAGLGTLARRIIEGHLDQPTAIGPDSPWGRVAQMDNGYILFLGCDQDRNTLLHTAEDIANGAYLKTLQRDYYDEQRQIKTLVMERFPGPHRDFIQMDRLFLEAGAMQIGKIGGAVCRLMKAKEILSLAVEALRRDPAAVLCDNPHCVDCVKQRAAIKRARLEGEDFILSALVDDVYPPERFAEALWGIQSEGIRDLEVSARFAKVLDTYGEQALRDLAGEVGAAGCKVAVWPCEVPWDGSDAQRLQALREALTQAGDLSPAFLKLSPWLCTDAQLAQALPAAVEALRTLAVEADRLGVKLLIENHPAAIWRDRDTTTQVLATVNHPALRLSFNPTHFAQVGEHPFLSTWNRGKLKKYTAQLMVADGCGRAGWPAIALPGRGQGEVKELISILRCRSFQGLMTISVGGSKEFSFTEAAEAFWRLLNTM